MLIPLVVILLGWSSARYKNRKSVCCKSCIKLLKAVNLDELITTSNEQYEKMALKLATNKDYLNSIKKTK